MRKLMGILVVVLIFAMPAEVSAQAEDQISLDALREGIVLCNNGPAPCVYLMEELLDPAEIALSIDLLEFADLIAGSDTFTMIIASEQHQCRISVTGARGSKIVTVVYDEAEMAPAAVLNDDRFSIRIGESVLSVEEQQWLLPSEWNVGVRLSFLLDRYRYDQNPDPMKVKATLTAGEIYVSDEAPDPGPGDETDPKQDFEGETDPGHESENPPEGVDDDKIQEPSIPQIKPTVSLSIPGVPVQDSELKKAVPWLCASAVALILIVSVMLARLKMAAHGRAIRSDLDKNKSEER